MQSNRYSLLDCEEIPVEETDKWCLQKFFKGQVPVGDAPWGYIVTIPYCPRNNTFLDNVDGYIVRIKKHCGNLLLQVVKKEYAPKYGLKSFARQEPNVSKKKRKKRFTVFSTSGISISRKVSGKKTEVIHLCSKTWMTSVFFVI